jgi:hypothetical protein
LSGGKRTLAQPAQTKGVGLLFSDSLARASFEDLLEMFVEEACRSKD